MVGHLITIFCLDNSKLKKLVFYKILDKNMAQDGSVKCFLPLWGLGATSFVLVKTKREICNYSWLL